MPKGGDGFDASILRQIKLNPARTPTQRLLAVCELLDLFRAMAPDDEAARERRRRVLASRMREREAMRAQFKRWIAAEGRSAT